MTARFADRKGLAISAATPNKKQLPQWPAKIGLEVKYPIENVTVIRTIVKPTGKPIKVADGIIWYLDPTRAVVFDQAGIRKLSGKTAGVLRTNREMADPLVTYDVRVILGGGKKLASGGYKTVLTLDKTNYIIDVSKPFGGPGEIERIEFTRCRHALIRFDDVAVRRDFLADLKE